MRHLLGQFPLHVRESRGSMNIDRIATTMICYPENGLNLALKNIDSSNKKHVEFGELQTAEGTWSVHFKFYYFFAINCISMIVLWIWIVVFHALK